jgi:hypothetical protein
MNRLISQMPLAERIPALTESVRSTRAMKENYQREEASLMEQLAQAEGEVLGKAPGWEGVALSGLIPAGENPYATESQGEGFIADTQQDEGAEESFLGGTEESEPAPKKSRR